MMTGKTQSSLRRGGSALMALVFGLTAGRAQADTVAATPAPAPAQPAAQSADTSVYPSPGVGFAGATGYGRVESADAGRPGSLRLSLRGGYFQHGSFPAGGSDRLFTGELSAGFTFFKGFEAYAAFHNSSNSNSEANPKLVQSLGDVFVGAKWGGKVGPTTLAGDLRFNVMSGIGTDYLSIPNSTVQVRALSTTPFKIAGQEFEADVNLGGIFGRSHDAVDPRMTQALLFGTGYSAYNRIVAGGALVYHHGWLNPFLTLDLDEPFGISQTALKLGKTTALAVGAKRLGIGTRFVLSPSAGAIDVLVEGASSHGVIGYARTQPWMAFLGYSFAFDSSLYQPPAPPPPPPAAPPPPPPPTTGDLRGSVIDSATGHPVKGAVIVIDSVPPVATGEDGVYIAHNVKAGAKTVRIEREGYKPNAVDAKITAGSEEKVAQVKLEALPPPAPPAAPAAPKAPPAGYVAGQIRSGLTGVAGVIRIVGESTTQVRTSVDGTFSLKLAPGRYDLVLLADGYLARAAVATVNADEATAVVVQTAARPATSGIKVDGDKISLVKPMTLDEKKVDVAAADQTVLAEIADVVARDPSKKLVIAVHSDQPKRDKTDRVTWTEERALAIRAALIAQGVPAERVEAKGYGVSQPIVPSTSKGAAKNRRVEFSLAPVPAKKVVPISLTPAAAPAAPVEQPAGGDFGGMPPPPTE